ncbi:MAG: methyltransferase domain-containing protein [Bacteroidia bacterium]|nr:methyltransferase domain-containing protein [Bacteroidia bacterium]
MVSKQKEATSYYDSFSNLYDWLSPKWYYHEARAYAIQQLHLDEATTVLNLPCGTGQNFEYFQKYMNGSGLVIGIDLSEGMLEKAIKKKNENNWSNIKIINEDATQIRLPWIKENIGESFQVNAIFCDLGLSGFPDWKRVIDNLLSILSPGGRLVIMDWYIPKPTLRGRFVKWIGKGEVDRPIYQYLENQVANFKVNTSFNRGNVFVAIGVTK